MKIAVGGFIASGKSTLVKGLSRELDLKALDEFDQDDEVFNTMLQWLYEGKPNVEMLLQLYFLHHHWINQKELRGDVIVDRHVIEHWLFAQTNLQGHPEVLNMYNGLFHQYMNNIEQPSLYIILKVDWPNFKQRLMARGRPAERDNFERNTNYFRQLHKEYLKKLKAQCDIYDIPHVVIDTNGKPEKEVLITAKKLILERF